MSIKTSSPILKQTKQTPIEMFNLEFDGLITDWIKQKKQFEMHSLELQGLVWNLNR